MFLIFSSFNSTTRNEIKKAEKIGMIFNVKKNISLFVEFYNNFAKIKKLALLDIKKIEPMGNITEITYVTMENGSAHVEPLVMHLYLVDYIGKRVTLSYSASLFRYEKLSTVKNIIGNANRFLHYNDMIYFKSKGFKIYDLGGYAKDTNDSEKKGINFFKDSFGGEFIEESNYFSIPAYIGKKIQIIFNNIAIIFRNF